MSLSNVKNDMNQPVDYVHNVIFSDFDDFFHYHVIYNLY